MNSLTHFKFLRAIFAGILLVTAVTAKSAVTFSLRFADVDGHTNANWDDPNYGAQARSTLQNSLNEFGQAFTTPITITLTLNITSSMSTNYYASAATSSYQLDPTGRFYDGNTYTKITTGVDTNGAEYDGHIDYSFNLSALNFPDLNGDGSRDVRDFTLNVKGLTRHELLHVLGMTSFISAGVGANQKFTRHDGFLQDSTGQPYVSISGSMNPSVIMNDANALFYSPVTGASFKVASAGDFSHLMGPMYPYHESFNSDDKTYLRTLGYAVAPEPSSIGLLLVIGGIALARRPRR